MARPCVSASKVFALAFASGWPAHRADHRQAAGTRLVGGTLGEDGGDFGFGEGEAGAGGGEGGGELGMVFAEVLGGDEEVVVAGGVEPVADGRTEVAGHERVDEAQLAECARRRNDGHELEDRADVGGRFGVATDAVLLPFRRRIDGRLEVEELPSGL